MSAVLARPTPNQVPNPFDCSHPLLPPGAGVNVLGNVNRCVSHIVTGDFRAGTDPHGQAGMEMSQVVKRAWRQSELLERWLEMPVQQLLQQRNAVCCVFIGAAIAATPTLVLAPARFINVTQFRPTLARTKPAF
jgi:hypothetical protein